MAVALVVFSMVISANYTGATSAVDAGNHSNDGDSPELLGTALQITASRVVCGYGELAVRRILWSKQRGLGWSVVTAAAS